MKIRFILFFSAAILVHGLSAQNRAKMNFGAAIVASEKAKQESNITLLVQGTISEIQAFTERTGGTFLYAIGDIASVTIKGKDIKALADQPYVIRVEADNPYSKTQVMSDTMLVHNRVVKVHAGAAPLAQAYKGDGVVVGIIDTGIDYNHPDFKDASGKTRIKYLWDQVLPDSAPPLPYNYGQEWTAADIDNGKAGAHKSTFESQFGHGTHVASMAAGNGLAMSKYAGVAPNADIIFVAADLNGTNSILDATKYIYAKATLLGKPCVINVSLGDYYGSHDGKNLEAQSIKTLITSKPGRSFVAASGNAGHLRFHLGYPVTSDTSFTWYSGSAYISMYSDTATFKNVKFAIGADKKTPSYSFRGNTSFSTVAPHIGVLGYDTIYNGSNRLCTILSYGDVYMGVNSMEFAITADSTSYSWRLMTTGSGKFDGWSFNVDTAHLADSIIYPPLKKYKQPDLKSNMVSSFQCLDEVITVGNYTNRDQYRDYYDTLQFEPTRVPGGLFSSSSRGPTRDGRIKPDITSPGDWTMGAIVTTRLTYLLSVGNGVYIAPGGFHILDGGTSNASPCVAGIAALYLQMDPTAGWQAVKNSITNCARMDTITGFNLPNNDWGYGKADAYAMMTGCATSNNTNQNTEFDILTIYPNPSSNEVNIAINLTGTSPNAELEIYDVVGKKLRTIQVKNPGHVSLPKGSLQSGIYFCTLRSGERIISTKKLIISE